MSMPSSPSSSRIAFETPGLRGEQRLGGLGQVEVAAHRFLDEPELVEVHGEGLAARGPDDAMDRHANAKPRIIHRSGRRRGRPRRRPRSPRRSRRSPDAGAARPSGSAARSASTSGGRSLRTCPPMPRKSGTTSIRLAPPAARRRAASPRSGSISSRKASSTGRAGSASADPLGDRQERLGPARVAGAVGEQDQARALIGIAPARRRRRARPSGRARRARPRRSTASSCRAGRGGERRCSAARSSRPA